MHRRRLIQTALFSMFVGSTPAATHPAPDPVAGAVDVAAVAYAGNASADLRHVSVRVSRWADAAEASRFGVSCLNQAGSDLPEGEFYQTEPVDLVIPDDLLAPPAMARGWQTTVGVAAFTTDFVLLVVQREDLVWDLRVGGAVEAHVVDVAVDLAAELVERDPEGPLAALLPGPDDVPTGLQLVDLGTPVAMGDNPDARAHLSKPDVDG